MRKEFSFPSADGKTSIYAVKRVPDDGRCRAVIQLTHGMVEYIGRYKAFADFLESQGFVVVGHDHLGHGHSVTGDEELGFFDDADPAGVLVKDMDTLRRMTQKEYPDLPYIMFGHSMGSYLLRMYLSQYGEGLAGAIICGTGYEKPGTTGFALWYINLLTKLHGSHYRSSKVQQMTYGKPYKKFDTTGAHPEQSWLSKNIESVKTYYQDPWCTYTFTLNGYRGLLEAVRYSGDPANIDRIPKNLPLLIISGRNDPVGNLGKNVELVRDLYQKAGIEDITLHLYDYDRHEILNEPDHEQVYKDILEWTNRILG
ncbi:MAG: alpha/beta fold hydrolase [Eubacterium sp.]|nr:alpha/beta fold hydrolase [Eubacterium sp.]